MNNSKKITPKKEKEVKMSEKPITSISKPWIVTSLVLVVVLIGALLFDQLYSPTLMTVDGKKYNVKDLSYYLYIVESKYDSYNSMFGGNYWDSPIKEDGTTLRQEARKDAIAQALRATILYNEAVDKDYKLTDKEKKTVKTTVDNLLSKEIPKDIIKKNHFTRSFLTKMVEGTTLVSRFREDKLKEAKIDKDGIKAKISYDKFRQYDIEYLYAATETTDENGKTTQLSDEKKKEAQEKLNSYYEKAKTAKDWSKVVPTDETAIIYKASKFVKADEDSSSFSDEFKTELTKMKNGAVSEVTKGTNGYYIVRMVNHNSSERYDSEVNTAITTAENQAFDKIYEGIKANHPNKLNNKAINRLKMGELTVIPSSQNVQQ